MTTRRTEAGMISERLAMNNQQFVSGRQSFGLKDLARKIGRNWLNQYIAPSLSGQSPNGLGGGC
jgi:hypothetical protein